MDQNKALRIKIFLAFSAIYLVWGSTYLAIRFAIETIPPFLMAGSRFVVGGSALYLWRSRTDRIKPGIREWRKSALVGLLLIVGGNGMLTWSEQYIPSGLAALLLAIIPVWMVLLDWILVVKKRPSSTTITGILLGVIGVGLLSGVDRGVLLAGSHAGRPVFIYALLLTLAAISWASGSLYSRTIHSSASLLYLVSIQMLAGGISLIFLGTIRGEWGLLSLENISLRSVVSLTYLVVFGTVLTYSAYNWLLRKSSPAKVGTYAFFNPLVAVFLGWLLAGEIITVRILMGAACILTAVVLVNQSRYFRRVFFRMLSKGGVKVSDH
jgi:drug/metabolite transporter (DMT)-like permease